MDVLGDVVAGLRFLPTRTGWAPFTLVYKQTPVWLTDTTGGPPYGGEDVEALGSPESMLEVLIDWWSHTLAQVRNKLDLLDQ